MIDYKIKFLGGIEQIELSLKQAEEEQEMLGFNRGCKYKQNICDAEHIPRQKVVEQIEKKSKKFCQDIMHSSIEIPSLFNISSATSPNLHLTRTPNFI